MHTIKQNPASCVFEFVTSKSNHLSNIMWFDVGGDKKNLKMTSNVGALKQGYFQIRFDPLTCEELAILTWRQK